MLLPNIVGLALWLMVSVAVEPVSYEYSPRTDANGKATVTVVFNQPASGVDIVIRGDDGSTIKRSPGSMKSGKRYAITWSQKGGRVRYEMELTGEQMSGTFGFEIAKSTGPQGKVGKLSFTSSREDLVDRHQAKYKTSFALTSYEYKVIDDDGDVIASDLVTQEIPAGGTFSFSWDSPAAVFMVEVHAEDQFGAHAEDRRVPYSAEIPHTEINFDSGKAAIKPGEVPKLDEAVAVAFHQLDKLDRVNKAVQANLTPQLYIVGYTDTVGNGGRNQTLSQSRAKSIAQYFYNEGFWAEIYYAGMGERGLRVQTDDNVDEVRNRRALYLIAFSKPGAGGQIPGRWTRLSGTRSRPPGFELPALPDKYADWADGKDEGKTGGASDSADPAASGADRDDDSDWGGRPEDETDDGSDYGAGDDGPPPVEGEPGASAKGCRIGQSGATPYALGWFVLLGVAVRRRRVHPPRR